eukprot:Skav213115  [mRNA]  locus=scaffold107:37661:42058:+ [translate_table: standard]
MALPAFLRRPEGVGARFSGVFSYVGSFDDVTLHEARLVGTDLSMIFDSPVPHGIFTVFGALIREMDPCFLGFDDKTLVVSHDPHRPFDLSIKEVCAGMGGIGIGGEWAGGKVVASLDCSSIACSHLTLNGHGEVLCRDLADDQAKADLYLAGGIASTLAAGFPCQPHSTQGRRLGHRDSRHQTFVEVLRTAFLHQVQCLVLECTPQAQYDTEVKSELHKLAILMGWHIKEVTLALSQQWPCRRHRWWALLYPQHWGDGMLHKWPVDDRYQMIGNILPDWGLWDDSIEVTLRLTPNELQVFMDPQFGSDDRILTLQSMAATFLRSYGSIFTACPCGCRDQPFALATLVQKGLRGCFVLSRRDGQPRYLHPSELSALLGVPQTVSHLSDVKAALCLLGQNASPLQAVWLFSHLVSFASGLSDLETLQGSLDLLQTRKIHLVRELFHLWSSDSVPRHVALILPDGSFSQVLTYQAVTVLQLVRAESYALACGEQLEVLDGDRVLPPSQLLLACGRFGPYRLRLLSMAQVPSHSTLVMGILHQNHLHVALLHPGSFVFEALAQCQIEGVDHLVDADARFYGLDFRIWDSLRLITVSAPLSPQLGLVGYGWASSGHCGLTDTTIWSFMTHLFETLSLPGRLGSILVSPCQALDLLDGVVPDSVSDSWPVSFGQVDGDLFCIFVSFGHWTLLWGRSSPDGLAWFHFDGLGNMVLPMAHRLVRTLSQHFGLPHAPMFQCCLQPQQLPFTCGTVALLHLCMLVHGGLPVSVEIELLLHSILLSVQPPHFQMIGLGRSADDVAERLAAFQEERGVPAEATGARAAEAIKVIGLAALTEALGSPNPWATLKGLASRPSTRFRWVKEAELKAHIAAQAKQKHGVAVPNAKAKKHTSKEAKASMVDPNTLQLIPSSFIDEDEDSIPQIPFHEVSQDAHGLAFCSYQDAKPFIEAGQKISAAALGLLITSEIPRDFWGHADLSVLRFPAVCSVTDEPLLLQGMLLNLGDTVISRKEHSSPDLSAIDTEILKVQIYQDEVQMDWSQLIAAPIRGLIHLVPLMKLCHGKRCGSDCHCPHFHAPVGESLQGIIVDLWSRGFHNAQGKNTKAAQAHYFQVMVRIPAVALESLVKAGVRGVYLEPRASSFRGPHERFCVIWLAGHDRDQAQHKLRTCAHGLALARLHTRYGIRAAKQHEQKVHNELKPDDEFVDIEVKQVYSLFPLPFGLRRAQLNKLLAAWKWKARPLQPIKGNLQGQAWTVGASDPPPSKVMTGFDRDILITLQKEVNTPSIQQPLVASQRTRKFLKEGAPTLATSSGADPWQTGSDPWAGFRPTGAPVAAPAASASRFAQIQETIKDEIQKQVQSGPPGLPAPTDIQRLEVNIAELQAQGSKFQSWFQEAGTRMCNTEQQLQQLHKVVEQQGQTTAHQIAQIQSEVDNKTQLLQSSLQGNFASLSSDLDSKLDSQFSRFEALLAKRRKLE